MAETVAQNLTAYKINHFGSSGGNGYLMKRRARTSIPLSRKFEENIGKLEANRTIRDSEEQL